MKKVLTPLFLISFLFIINCSNAQVVISQVYGGGGNSGATLKNDFIEIFNRGTTTVDLSGWSIQYASTNGSTWQRTNLSGLISAGQYYLIQQAQGAGGTVNLPTPDVIGTIPMAAGAGKVVLLNTNLTITSGTVCPSGVNVQDIVGYGTGTNCFEGSGPTATLTNTTSALRGASGCTDNNNNSVDFATGTPNPRNTSSSLNPCTGGISINNVSLNEGNTGATSFIFTVTLSSAAGPGGVTFDIATQDNTAISPDDFTSNSLTGQTIAEGNSTYMYTVLVNGDITIEPNESFFVNITNVSGAVITDGQGVGAIINDDCEPTHTIAQIQGNGNSSPFSGASVSINGIVTGLRSNGFFMQTQLAEYDADQNTSEGIFVFTGGTPPAGAAIGNKVCVSGNVTEFIPSADPNSPSTTEIINPVIIVLSTGNPLPVPVILTGSDTDPSGGIYQLEKYEGMRVQVNSLTVVAPTQGNITESSATAISTGYFYGVITGVNRPFREAGIQLPDALPPGAPATVTRWDANPELIGVASLAQPGSLAINVATGAVITNIIGPLDFTRRYYTIDVDAASPHVVSNNSLTFTAIPAQTNEELTVASFNMQRFYDAVNDPGGDVALSASAYNNRLNKASLAIRNVLRFPDIIGVIEVEKLSVLQELANRVNNDAIAAAQPNPNYQAYLEEGNDPGGIDVGFLVKSPRITVTDVTQYGKTTTYINPNNGSPELLNDRPPLVLRAEFNQPGCTTPYPVTVIVNHLRSLNDIDDVVDGNRVRVKRRTQAEYLANLIQEFQTTNPNVNIVSVGDYNAFQFSDGFVDLIGTIKGAPTPAADVVLASPDLVNPDLIDLVDTHTPDQRYSYSFMGNAQVLDHILINQNLSGKVSRFSIARMDADFPEIVRNDASRPERISDHDVPVAYILFTDTEIPNAVCRNITITLVNGTASITAADVDGGSTDNCGIQTLSVSKSMFDCTNIGNNNVTLTVTDVNENSSTCTAIVTVVGEIPSCSISSIPENNIYTDGVSTNIYLGYGPQNVTLDLTPSGGNSFTYSWSGNGTLTCTDCQDPVFAPTSGGIYQFTATVTNNYGCTTTCTITICVLDIRVPGTNGDKVYICHSPSGNPGNAQTLALNVSDVPDHIPQHGSDRLGKCNEFPCEAKTIVNAGRFIQNAATPEKSNPTFTVAVLPNPSNNYFNLFIQDAGNNPVTVRILDTYGRQVFKKYNIAPDSNIKIGSELINGIYFAEIIKGKERKVIKLVKVNN